MYTSSSIDTLCYVCVCANIILCVCSTVVPVVEMSVSQAMVLESEGEVNVIVTADTGGMDGSIRLGLSTIPISPKSIVNSAKNRTPNEVLMVYNVTVQLWLYLEMI